LSAVNIHVALRLPGGRLQDYIGDRLLGGEGSQPLYQVCLARQRPAPLFRSQAQADAFDIQKLGCGLGRAAANARNHLTGMSQLQGHGLGQVFRTFPRVGGFLACLTRQTAVILGYLHRKGLSVRHVQRLVQKLRERFAENEPG